MRAEHYWHRALERSLEAQRSGALVPLATEIVPLPGLEPFVLRRLLSRTPKHLRGEGIAVMRRRFLDIAHIKYGLGCE